MGRTNTNTKSYGDVNKTAVIEARCDIRRLAGCYKYFKDKDIPIYSKSDLVRFCIDMLHNTMVDNKMITEIEEFDDAKNILLPLGRTGRDRRGDMHISAFVNKQDFEQAIGDIDIDELQRLIAERKKKDTVDSSMFVDVPPEAVQQEN